MIYILLGLILQILGQVNHLPIWSQVIVSQVLDPWRYSCGTQNKLRQLFRTFFDLFKYFIDVLFESHVKHLVSLVQDQRLEL